MFLNFRFQGVMVLVRIHPPLGEAPFTDGKKDFVSSPRSSSLYLGPDVLLETHLKPLDGHA